MAAPFREAFFERLVRFAPDAVIVTRKNRIVLANDRAQEMFGYCADEMLGREPELLVPERGRAAASESLADATHAAKANDFDVTGLRKDGSEFPAAVALRPVEVEGESFVMLAIRDMSRRRPHTDEDVALVSSVAHVASAATGGTGIEQRPHAQHLHRAEQMMAVGQVAAGVAHELRNPLTAIKGLVQVNLREARARGMPDDDLVVIEHEIRRMERALQTFLDFARPPRPERRRLDPATVVERVFAVVAGRAAKQGVSLGLTRPESPVWLEADQDQLQQLLLNLILNSLDAMPRGGQVEVVLRPPCDGLVELRVRDTGPGIPAHILPKVFETFVSSKETGVGLGVPVSRRIAEDHGGSLSAYNLSEGGACFVLRLPAISPSERAARDSAIR